MQLITGQAIWTIDEEAKTFTRVPIDSPARDNKVPFEDYSEPTEYFRFNLSMARWSNPRQARVHRFSLTLLDGRVLMSAAWEVKP